MTRDLADVRPLLSEALRRGSATYGLIYVPRRFALNRDGIGHLFSALLTAHHADDALVSLGGETWLTSDPS